MNTIEQASETIWQSMVKEQPASRKLCKTLRLADASHVQVNVLRRWQSQGRRLAGKGIRA